MSGDIPVVLGGTPGIVSGRYEKDEGARSFAHLLTQIDEGSFNEELSAAMRELARDLNSYACKFRRDGKGEIAIGLRVAVDEKGVTSVVGEFKVKRPKVPRASSQFFLTVGGNLSLENPRQQKLPLREVAGPGPARELADDIQPVRSF